MAGSDKLVDNTLGGVEEVAELRLPANQGVGVGHRVAELEAEHAELGERAVAHRVRCLVGVQAVERPVSRFVARLVVEDVVTVAERPALHILTAEPDVDSFLTFPTNNQRG